MASTMGDLSAAALGAPLELPVSLEMSRNCELGLLLLQAVLTVWHGAKLSLFSSQQESLDTKNALMLPVFVTFMLLGLFCLLLYANIAIPISLLFVVLSANAVYDLACLTAQLFLSISIVELSSDSLFTGLSPRRPRHLLVLGASLCVAVLTMTTRHWLLNNLCAVAICLSSIGNLSLGSFRAASALLSGLFLYDVWFVFGTRVMMTVAEGIGSLGPLLFRSPGYPLSATHPRMHRGRALGLGDIVFPGLFVALMLRYDLLCAYRRLRRTSKSKDAAGLPMRATHLAFPTPYFLTAVASFAAGILLAFVALSLSSHPQPALLYIVPCCLGSCLLLAVARGELGDLWNANLGFPSPDSDPPTASPSDDVHGAAASPSDDAHGAAASPRDDAHGAATHDSG